MCEGKIKKEGTPLDYLKLSLNCKNCYEKKKKKKDFFFHSFPQPVEVSFFTHQNSFLYEDLEFKCSCCDQNFDKKKIFENVSLFSRYNSLLNQRKLADEISSKESFLQLKTQFHPFNYAFFKFQSNLIDFLIEKNNFSHFLCYLCVDLLGYLDVHSPSYYPVKGVAYATAAKVLAFNNNLQEAITKMKEAISILTITCKNKIFFFFFKFNFF